MDDALSDTAKSELRTYFDLQFEYESRNLKDDEISKSELFDLQILRDIKLSAFRTPGVKRRHMSQFILTSTPFPIHTSKGMFKSAEATKGVSAKPVNREIGDISQSPKNHDRDGASESGDKYSANDSVHSIKDGAMIAVMTAARIAVMIAPTRAATPVILVAISHPKEQKLVSIKTPQKKQNDSAVSREGY